MGIPGPPANRLFHSMFRNFPPSLKKSSFFSIRRIDLKLSKTENIYFGDDWLSYSINRYKVFFQKQKEFNKKKKKPFEVQQLISETGVTINLNGRKHSYFIRFCRFERSEYIEFEFKKRCLR